MEKPGPRPRLLLLWIQAIPMLTLSSLAMAPCILFRICREIGKITLRDFDISVVNPIDSTWSKPLNVTEVNSDSIKYSVSIADNGNLYFASNRKES